MDNWKSDALIMRREKKYGTDRIAMKLGKTEDEIRAYLKSVGKDGKVKPPAAATKKFISYENLVPRKHMADWDGSTRITFGLIGDTHFSSKYAQLTHLSNFYKVCAEMGVKDVYHTGDIDDGEQMRLGHQYECYAQGADDHVSEIVKNYPKYPGCKTHFITGNHDASIYKKCGVDIGKAIAKQREDLIYLGRDWAKVKLTPNCILELRHPWDGGAYALSYRPQKLIESMDADSKPNILAIGHYHKIGYLFYRNVHCFLSGCYQSQTPFIRGKGLSVHMGGWLVTVEVDKLGHVLRIVPEMVPCYKGIDDDYMTFID